MFHELIKSLETLETIINNTERRVTRLYIFVVLEEKIQERLILHFQFCVM